MRYGQFPGLCRAVAYRHVMYNRTLDLIDEMEAMGELFVIRPAVNLAVSRTERDQKKLMGAYDLGYKVMGAVGKNLSHYLI